MDRQPPIAHDESIDPVCGMTVEPAEPKLARSVSSPATRRCRVLLLRPWPCKLEFEEDPATIPGSGLHPVDVMASDHGATSFAATSDIGSASASTAWASAFV